jgi:glutathione synthase/RimK-type ligase-like ATP-grasp enzyme
MVIDQKLGTAELLFRSAQQMGLTPSWVIPLDTFAISIDGQERYINLARSPLNSDASVSLAKNKYITRRILERHKMPNIPFSLPRSQAEAVAFLEKYEKIIAKPVSGAGSHDIHIVTQKAQLMPLKISDYILEKYVLGKELRYLVLSGRVIGVHRSEYGTSVEYSRQLQRISYPRSLWDPALISSSLRTAGILGLQFAAVDYLIDTSGRAYILEVNTMPGLKWFHAPSSGPVVDVARLFLESVVDEVSPVASSTPVKLVSPRMEAYS